MPNYSSTSLYLKLYLCAFVEERYKNYCCHEKSALYIYILTSSYDALYWTPPPSMMHLSHHRIHIGMHRIDIIVHCINIFSYRGYCIDIVIYIPIHRTLHDQSRNESQDPHRRHTSYDASLHRIYSVTTSYCGHG